MRFCVVTLQDYARSEHSDDTGVSSLHRLCYNVSCMTTM